MTAIRRKPCARVKAGTCLAKAIFPCKDAAMTKALPRLAFFAALAAAASGPARAALPDHPPLPPPRPTFESDAAPDGAARETQPADATQAVAAAPEPPAAVTLATPTEEEIPAGFGLAEQAGLAHLARQYARQHGLPLSLLHRIIMRESRYHPRLVNRRYYGLMQMTPQTARSMGYRGAPKGLLDAETNLRYGVPYLANAWALADGDPDRAVRLYASGYYYTAKSRNMLGLMRTADSPPAAPQPAPAAEAPPAPAQERNFLDTVFGESRR
jgi:soluble lytic murein transglycosylase-like protein